MVNFVSVEPVVRGVRGQSELEVGAHGGKPGLQMWTADTEAGALSGVGGETPPNPRPLDPATPAAGRVERLGDTEALTFYLATEPFRNGARPVLRVTLRADRPHEVGFRVHSAPGGARMDSCVLSATMGNYGRLRLLWLRDGAVHARDLWPKFVPDRLGFAPWRSWQRDRLLQAGGDLLVAATSDEADPAKADYEPGVPAHWRYEGRPATHYWRTKDAEGVVARVNGREAYWGGEGRIPGGVAIENFELEAPFAEGQEFWLGVTPDRPEKLGFTPRPPGGEGSK
jgi:hypothetical protein